MDTPRQDDPLIALRLQLVRAGYTPLPLFGKAPPAHGKNNAKRGLGGWQTLDRVTLEQIRMWTRTWPDACNTGVLTKSMPTLDADILNEEAARAIEAHVREHCEERGYVLTRIGKPPKRAFPFRTDEPFKKITVNLVAANGDHGEKIEFLSDGQQVACFGIHPDTGQPYRWHGGTLGEITREDLPYIRGAEAWQLVDDVVNLLARDFGYSRAPERPTGKKTNGGGGHSGTSDWQWLFDNVREGRDLHTSLRDLAAKMIAGGMHAGVVVNQLRAIMMSSTAPHDDRWQDRYVDIPRLVESAGTLASVKDEKPKLEQNDEIVTAATTDLEMCGVDWLWPERFARGKFGLIAGLPDMGKGQIAAFITAVATAAVPLPCEEGSAPQGNVIWFNAEDGASDTIVPRLVAAGADRKRVHLVQSVHVDGKDRGFSLVTDLHLLRKAIKRIGNVVLVIIDPVSAYLGVGKVDGRSATDVRGVLTPMKDMAEELHVAVIGIAHFNKKDDIKSALLRVSDSIAYVAAARHVYAVLDDPEDKNSKLFVKAKNNLARDTKALRYGMGVKTVGHDLKLGVDITAPYIVWHPQHVTITANEAMQAGDGRTAKREAKEFLLERLEAGPVNSDDLLEEAKQEGIAEKTLRRAKKELGIKSHKQQGRIDSPWLWELPPKRESWPSS
jgi:hypothetical protein